MAIGRDDFYKIAEVNQHAEFEKYLKDILFDKARRNKFFMDILSIDKDVYTDTFKQYFEEYAAERKSNKQDYTPDSIAGMLAALTRSEPQQSSKWSGYDPTAGTGSLLIQKWKDDQLAESPFSYAPHNYLYRADELADNVIPYLLLNLALRGMNCIVVHGDTLERTAKQIYFVQNADDNFLGFSDINVMPHTEDVSKEFGIRKWLEKPIEHIESQRVKLDQPWLPMQRKQFQTNYDSEPGKRTSTPDKDSLRLSDIAVVERAKAKKVYPAGAIVIQMSATRGQIGLLKSSGEVGAQYAVAITPFDSGFVFYMLKQKAPRWFHRVQDGLNLKLEDIKQMPVAITLAEREKIYEQLSLDLGGD